MNMNKIKAVGCGVAGLLIPAVVTAITGISMIPAIILGSFCGTVGGNMAIHYWYRP